MIEIKGQGKIWENLPTPCVDLDKCVILGWGSFGDEPYMDAEVLDAIVNAGTVNGIGWGKTDPDEHGISTIIVDADQITENAIVTLSENGII